MNQVAIITDTDCSLPDELIARYGILQVPITIHFGEETFTTGVDINDRSLFEKVDRLKRLPTTSAPSPGAFANAFEAAFQHGAETLVCICVSSKVSATYNAALNARDSFPGREIKVVDSLNMSMGQGFMVLAAAQAASQGAGAAEAVARAADVGRRVHVFAVLATLKYLALSGRVGKIAAGMADTLNIKPILTVRDGKLELLERIRTRKKAVERLLELTDLSLSGKGIERAALIHVNNLDGAHQLQQQFCERHACPGEMITAEFTPGLSVHGGTGVVGLVVVAR